MATSRCTSDCRRFGHSDRCWMPNTATPQGALCRGIPSASSPAALLCPLASCPPAPPPAPGRQLPPPHAPRPSGAPRCPPALPAAAPGGPARSTEPPAPRAAFPPPAHGERPRAPANLGAVAAVHGEGAAGRGPGPARGSGEAAGSPAHAQPDTFLVRKASLGGGGRDEAAAPFPRCDEHYLCVTYLGPGHHVDTYSDLRHSSVLRMPRPRGPVTAIRSSNLSTGPDAASLSTRPGGMAGPLESGGATSIGRRGPHVGVPACLAAFRFGRQGVEVR
ncbi:unnamed protein product [Lampetra planeri]